MVSRAWKLSNLPFSSQVAATPHAQPFSLQLVQRALEDSLAPLQRAFHQDIHNLHLELLRQFHIQQVSGLAFEKFPTFRSRFAHRSQGEKCLNLSVEAAPSLTSLHLFISKGAT